MPGTGDIGTRWAERLIRRSLIKTTHQAIAFGALGRLTDGAAPSWRRLFLRYGRAFAEGAAAPDADFRDWRNHVLFPAAAGWGGGPVKAEAWYRNLVAALSKHDWGNAAFSAGVLTHYIADPLNPLHTGLSDGTSDVHFAIDAAVHLDYPDLARQASVQPVEGDTALAPGAGFVQSAVMAGAHLAQRERDELTSAFELGKAARTPTAALDANGRRIVAGYIARATALVAAVLDRAIAEAGVEAPSRSLVLVGMRAWAGKPFAAIGRGLRRRALRRAVRAMVREYARTGRVERTLRAEERGIRDAFARDVATGVATPAAPAIVTASVLAFGPKPAVRGAEAAAAAGAVVEFGKPAVTARAPALVARDVPVAKPSMVGLSTFAGRPGRLSAAGTVASRPIRHDGAVLGQAGAAVLVPSLSGGLSNFRDRRTHPPLRAPFPGEAPVARAPAADWLPPDEPPKPVRLIEAIPGLRRGEAQLLVVAGYPTPAAIAEADVDRLCADVLRAALTSAGRDALRAAPAPDIEKIRAWVSVIRATRAA